MLNCSNVWITTKYWPVASFPRVIHRTSLTLCSPSAPTVKTLHIDEYRLPGVQSYTVPDFEWDRRKEASNVRKHGIRFADAVSVLEDDRSITVSDDSIDEERWVTIGMDALSRVLVVVYTCRGENIRIISARRATSRESGQYPENL